MPFSPSPRFELALTLRQSIAPVWVLVVENAPAIWSTKPVKPRSDAGPSSFDTAAQPLIAGALDVKSIGGSRVYPTEGKYAVGELAVTIRDDAALATLWQGTERAGGSRTFRQRVTLYAGAEELEEDLYQPAWSGYIDAIETEDGCATFDVKGVSILAGWDREIMANCIQVQGSVKIRDDVGPYDSFEGNSDLSAVDGAYIGLKLKFTSGKNEGDEFDVVDYRQQLRKITISPPAENPLSENDSFTIYNFVKITGSPLNIFVRLLLGDFALTGTIQDDWPLDAVEGTTPTGLDLDPSMIDAAQIQAERDRWTLGMKLRLQWAEPEQARQCFEEQIFRILGAYPVVSVDGLLRVRMGRPAGPGAAPFEITEDLFEKIPKWSRQTDEIITRVRVYGDLNLASNKYQLFTDHETIDTRYRERGVQKTKVLEIKSRGLASDLSGQILADGMADRILGRFGTGGPEELQAEGTPRLAFLEAGEPVKVTHSKLPNLATGKKGKRGEAFEVVQNNLDPTALRPKVTLVGFSPTGRPGFIAPDDVAELYEDATDADKQYAYNSPASGNFPDDGLPYKII
jgi:hypothetical protein